ncbi:hypothetical protein V6N12_007979 [Hibiscus sabdariffa]|uniref:RNase H type-1 domain-containing protein n=1 Tax=Hibiscus sabdariffa TaxID=183260 RepID=A0ABR2BSZ3_9ROSI
MTSCDGVLRNEKGERVVGYSKKVGSCSVIETELWGILEGLNQAWRIGCRRLWVEFDCSEQARCIGRVELGGSVRCSLSSSSGYLIEMICSVVRTTGVVNRSGLRFATGCVLNSTTNTRSAAAGTALLHRLEDLRVRTSALSRHAKILRHALLHQNLNALGPSPCYHRCNDIQRVIKATWSKSKCPAATRSIQLENPCNMESNIFCRYGLGVL